MGVIITGLGHDLPGRIVTNQELEERLDTTDAWIRSRTGIRQRHIAAEDETTTDLAMRAAQEALRNAGRKAQEIDLILVATATPANSMPSVATQLQGRIGASCPAMDLNAACSGFVYAAVMAEAMIQAGRAEKALVVGAECMSRLLDWEDRATCVLFGDGAGAAVLEKCSDEGRGMKAARLHADGALHGLIHTDGGVSTTRTAGFFRMEGKEVFRHAVEKLTGCLQEVLAEAGVAAEEVDWVVPHQANQRIIHSVTRHLGIAPEKVVLTISEHANTSSASVPLALWDMDAKGLLQPGQWVVLEALGAGLTWGATLWKW